MVHQHCCIIGQVRKAQDVLESDSWRHIDSKDSIVKPAVNENDDPTMVPNRHGNKLTIGLGGLLINRKQAREPLLRVGGPGSRDHSQDSMSILPEGGPNLNDFGQVLSKTRNVIATYMAALVSAVIDAGRSVTSASPSS